MTSEAEELGRAVMTERFPRWDGAGLGRARVRVASNGRGVSGGGNSEQRVQQAEGREFRGGEVDGKTGP